ncbi:hypothetical protein KBD75_01495 [Candidatus Woesebacteria bacterium]|nr:hypothetical protein [Candidatus Woesebacteria bacterium]
MELNNSKTQIVIGLIFAGIISRIVPHPLNMALVTGATIFAGSRLGKLEGVIVALGSMAISDLILGAHDTMLFTWGSFALIALLSHKVLSTKLNLSRLAITTLSSSLIFFVISNFGVWLVGNMYALTFSGLVTCYVNAIPFLRNMIVGDALYTSVIFGVYFFLSRKNHHLKLSPAR